jgi:hypothetical protein
MMRPAELFAIAATALLIFRFVGPVFTSPVFLDIHFRGTAYAFSPESVYLVMASFLCFYAFAYSLWILPLNRGAGLWHFWLTISAIAVFWVCFYLPPWLLEGKSHSGFGYGAVVGWFVSLLVLLLAQIIFVLNFALAIGKALRTR